MPRPIAWRLDHFSQILGWPKAETDDAEPGSLSRAAVPSSSRQPVPRLKGRLARPVDSRQCDVADHVCVFAPERQRHRRVPSAAQEAAATGITDMAVTCSLNRTLTVAA